MALAGVTAEPLEAMAGAELVLIDAPAAQIEARIDAIAAVLERGQHLHFETHRLQTSPGTPVRKIA